MIVGKLRRFLDSLCSKGKYSSNICFFTFRKQISRGQKQAVSGITLPTYPEDKRVNGRDNSFGVCTPNTIHIGNGTCIHEYVLAKPSTCSTTSIMQAPRSCLHEWTSHNSVTPTHMSHCYLTISHSPRFTSTVHALSPKTAARAHAQPVLLAIAP